jgi:hypothetical protein
MKILLEAKREAPHHPSPPFKEKEKGGEGGSKAWWPMEGSKAWWPLEGSKAWWPLECSKLGGHWKVKDKHLFISSIFPQQLYLHPQFFPSTLRFYFTTVLSRYFRPFSLFFEL